MEGAPQSTALQKKKPFAIPRLKKEEVIDEIYKFHTLLAALDFNVLNLVKTFCFRKHINHRQTPSRIKDQGSRIWWSIEKALESV